MNYNKYFTIIIWILTFSICSGQGKDGFTINGHLQGLIDGTFLYLVHKDNNNNLDTVAKVKSERENFQFRGRIPKEGEVYFIKIDTIHTKYATQIIGYITVFLENKKVHLSGGINDLSLTGINCTGPLTHNEYNDFQKEMKRRLSIQKMYLDDIQRTNKDNDSLRYYESKFDSINISIAEWKNEWIETHSNSLYTPYLILMKSDDLYFLQQQYKKLTYTVQQGKYANDLRNRIEELERTAIGSIMPGFILASVNGKSISLKDILSKSKFTVLDFWASWCGPCRAEFPLLKKTYEECHSKGLDIISYSVDKDINSWKRALLNEKLPWHNVREIINGSATKIYGVKALPMTFILDHEGHVLAKGLFGEDLSNKIKQLLNK